MHDKFEFRMRIGTTRLKVSSEIGLNLSVSEVPIRDKMIGYIF